MYPVLTFTRHTLIKAGLVFAKALYKLSGGRKPAFLFSATVTPHNIKSNVEIINRTDTAVTIAKKLPDGSYDPSPFKIMTATDFHLDPSPAELNNKTIKYFVRQIEENRPDLVILTGDVIESDFQQADAVQFSQMMEKLGVYWCYVFGNHETREEKEYFKYLLYKGLAVCPHCLNLFGDPSLFGYGNFAVHIRKNGNELLKSLYLFDSGRNIQEKSVKKYNLPPDMQGYDFIKREQIDWYVSEHRKAEEQYGKTGSFCYMHIPVPEYKNVFEGDEKTGFTPSGKCRILYGEQYESIGCAPYNSGLFAAGKENCSLEALFSGHDHINDFCAEYDGVYLVYTQATGYNTYTMADKFGWPEKDCRIGVTLTTVHPDGSFICEQKLNSDLT